ncbi:hypothetical protein OK016_26545 [Vibrio chagasii]|nr:hypothetical protein [Vibrio chagasii]
MLCLTTTVRFGLKAILLQLAFALDRIKEMAPEHPEWKTEAPFKFVLEGDIKECSRGGEEGLLKIIMATHSGMTVELIPKDVEQWLAASDR